MVTPGAGRPPSPLTNATGSTIPLIRENKFNPFYWQFCLTKFCDIRKKHDFAKFVAEHRVAYLQETLFIYLFIYFWKTLFHRKFLSSFLLILTQI